MNETLFDTLRKYASGTLTGEEKKAFEQRIAADPAFAAEVAEYAAMLAAIRDDGDRRLDTRLKEYARTLSQTDEQPAAQTSKLRTMTTYRRILYAAAAVVALLIVALPLWLNNRSGQTPDQLFAAHFTALPVPEVRDAAPQAWRDAYARGNYQEAAKLLEALLADTAFSQRSQAFLYLGVSQLALDHSDEALEALRKVSRDSYDWEEAQWYAALALLKSGRQDEAGIIIDDIVHQSGHPYREAAEAVRKDITK